MNNVKMTEKPILTPQQESKSLSSKRGRKKSIKHTLLSPHNANYSLTISAEEVGIILNILTTLPKLIPAKTPILWSSIKYIPKAERKAFRAHQQKRLPQEIAVRKNVILGINKVTDNLETNNVDVVLLSSDINPLYMAHHILELCVMNSIPVLIVENLRNTLRDTLGIASTCLGISVDAEDSILRDLCTAVRKIWVNYLQPGDFVVTLNNANCIINIDDSEDKMDSTTTTSRCASSSAKSIHKEKNVESSKSLHLIRTDTKTRVFVPPRTKKASRFDADFIQFTPPTHVVNSKYVEMQVGKMIANKRRIHHSNQRAKDKYQPNKYNAHKKKQTETHHRKLKEKGTQNKNK